MATEKQNLVEALRAMYGEIVTRPNLQSFILANPSYKFPNWLTNGPQYRAKRGSYALPTFDGNGAEIYPNVSALADTDVADAAGEAAPVVVPDTNRAYAFMGNSNVIPEATPGYVPFGNHNDIKKVIASRRFWPLFITGLSGNGKTTTVLQACHELKRGLIRANITCETDEDDLLGGMRIKNGNTEFQYGPVIEAMKNGYILLLDEIDLGSSRLMCLQPVLEGKGVYLKKNHEFVVPAPGFNIIATANTKGQGSETGKFIGTNVLNEAFLDRFGGTMEQEYPSEKTEIKILSGILNAAGCPDDDFVNKLVQWANDTRHAFNEQTYDELISTRRLVHIANAFIIFRDRLTSIQRTTDRFSPLIKKAFIDLYTKIDATIDPATLQTFSKPTVIEIPDNGNPFA